MSNARRHLVFMEPEGTISGQQGGAGEDILCGSEREPKYPSQVDTTFYLHLTLNGTVVYKMNISWIKEDLKLVI